MSEPSSSHFVKTRLVDNAWLVVVLLLLIDSLHFVFARLLLPHLPPVTSAMYVLMIGVVGVGLVWRRWGAIRPAVFRRHIWFFLGIGFLTATSTFFNYSVVAFIDPGTASLLSRASILFGLGLGVIWLQERLTRIQAIGAAVAIVGVFIISFQPGDYLRLGALIVLASAFMYALHAALVKRYGAQLGLVEFFFFRLACTAGFLFVFAAGQGKLVWPNRQAWLFLLLNGAIGVMIGRGLYYVALRRLKLSVHSLVLALSPVVTIGWTLLLFGIAPTTQQLIGGAAIIIGVLMVTMRY